MKISYEPKALSAIAARISRSHLQVHISLDEPDFTEIDNDLLGGKKVNFKDIDFTGPVASYKGRAVLVYIPDQGSRILEVQRFPVMGKKFHLTDCSTIEYKKSDGTYDRYIVTNDLSGSFSVYGFDPGSRQKHETRAELRVCKNCLKKLNYKGYNNSGFGHEIFRDFKISEFFETYSSYFKQMPRSFRMESTDYTADWSEISRRKREASGWTCSSCSIDLREHKRLLHTHHVNGSKTDNRDENLQVLCADCHKKQPHHDHVHVSRDDMRIINSLRKSQLTLSSNDWAEIFANTDTAIHGVLDMFKTRNWPMPEVTFDIQDTTGEIVMTAEVAWPSRRYAILLDELDRKKLSNWTIKTVAELQEYGI